MNENNLWWYRATLLLGIITTTGLALLVNANEPQHGVWDWFAVAALGLSAGLVGVVVQRLVADAHKKRKAGA